MSWRGSYSGPARGLYSPSARPGEGAVPQQRKIIPPVYMLFALLAMIGLHYAIPLAQVVESPLSYLGLVPLLVGITIAATAARLFDRAGTPKRPFERSTTLVTAGPYC